MKSSVDMKSRDRKIIPFSQHLPKEYAILLSADEIELFEERAAIMEYEGGLNRIEAEKTALEQLLNGRYGKAV